jgi:hypothetical protein
MLHADEPREIGSAASATRWRALPLLVVAILVTACSAGSDNPTGGSPYSETAAASSAQSTKPDAGSNPRPMSFEDLLSDPAPLVGKGVQVTGKVFFLAECPPPGSAAATKCVLQGYLAAPDRGVMTASDVAETIVLAEGGRRLSCEEGSQLTPSCGDWQNEKRYVVVGVVENQVLGGRTTSMVQLNVESKSLVP